MLDSGDFYTYDPNILFTFQSTLSEKQHKHYAQHETLMVTTFSGLKLWTEFHLMKIRIYFSWDASQSLKAIYGPKK